MNQKTAQALISRFEASVVTSKGFIRERDFAKQNGITEADIFTAYSIISQFEEFVPNLGLLLSMLNQLGSIMIITRNDYAVHQLRGCFDGFDDQQGIITTFGDINLSLSKNQCHRMFFKTKIIDGQSYSCLAIFDNLGIAVLKLFEQPNSNHQAWQDLIESLRSNKTLPNNPSVDEISNSQPKPTIEDKQVTHEFLKSLIEFSIQKGLIFHCKICNQSCCQSFSGIIHNFKIIKTWFNIMDGSFNLHLDISQCQLSVKKDNKRLFLNAKSSDNREACEISLDLADVSVEDYFDEITNQYGISKQ
ncbi:ChuX/HutX family heme-like substrate-binding protein [Bartonella sp. HY038]|uniref:ChuX/HutX family heme-like substrate-binding protein n=1 Tax=Bartonella sp. HY038 TaxID=2759660 RepID=UPI0015F850DB|nr:ChuX/HutX family heme-like substrate-binding protein [Bartonella sp. HY038]